MKIVDCFMYFDEDMMLDLRLNVLDKYVSRFIICEATYNHNGQKKKLNFNINNFSKFKSKIDYVVLDADALTVFSENPKELFIDCYPHTILTPHEGEFKKIFGNEINNIEERSLKTAEAAKISNTIVVLKGADTVIASPNGDVVVNKSSAAYLATAGSGDVLAGIISSLVGKNKMKAFDAACAGVWIHSEIGEILGSGMIAEDIIDMIPITVKKLIRSKQL